MKTWAKWVLVALPSAVLGMLLTSNGPLGNVLWPAAENSVTPTAAQMPFLVVLDVVQAIAFGSGIAFLVFGYPMLRQLPNMTRTYMTLVYVSIGWGLVNWVPHIGLHMSQGNLTESSWFWNLIGIDYAFHLTVLAAMFILAHFFLRVVRMTTAGVSHRVAVAADVPTPSAKAGPVGTRGRGK